MLIEVKIDKTCKEPKVIILTGEMTEEVNAIVKKLAEETPQLLTGAQNGTVKILEQPEIIRCYAANGKIYAETAKGEYTLRLRLYELEERLDKNYFVRISNSEIVNLRQVTGFDLKLTGTICVSLSNGTVTYASRRYVAKMKQVLGI